MEIFFLNESFEVIDGPVDGFTSVVWSERYYEVGSFVLKFPRSLYSRAENAVYVSGKAEDGGVLCGRVEYLAASADCECEMGGHLLEALLSDRVSEGGIVYSGTLTQALRDAVAHDLRGLDIEIAEDMHEIGAQVSLMSRWGNLADWLYTVLRPHGASFTVKLEASGGKPVFRLVCGVDRSENAADGVGRAVFSSSFGNITSLEHMKNTRGSKNVVFVKGSDGTVVTVDKSGGGYRREIYKSAADIVSGSFESDSEYIAALTMRGEEVLAEHPEALSVAAECDADALPRYCVDYALGDICDVADSTLGVSFGLRLTAVDTVYENGKRTVYPNFGDEIRYVKKLRSLS